MGSGMSMIIPGLYVGNFRDAKDLEKLNANNITHILAIHENAKKLFDDKEYLCIHAGDNPNQDLIQFFPRCIDFIHKARLSGGGVLVHCLAGVSRSVTVTAAYLMTVTTLGWREALNAIRGARNVANPNFGFQRQLQTYESEKLKKARRLFKEKYPENSFNDEADCRQLLHCFRHYVLTGEPTTSSSVVPKDEHEGLYPLPHNAYTPKRLSTLDPDSMVDPATPSASTVTNSQPKPESAASDSHVPKSESPHCSQSD